MERGGRGGEGERGRKYAIPYIACWIKDVCVQSGTE